MPWLGEGEPEDATAQKWHAAFKAAFIRRILPGNLSGPLEELSSKYPISPDAIAKVLVGFRAKGPGNDEPLLFNYAQILLRLKIVRPDHVLMALLDTSRFAKEATSSGVDQAAAGLPTCEERMFNLLTQMYMEPELRLDQSGFHGLIYALTRWMHAVSEYETAKQLEGGAFHTADQLSMSLYEALATLGLTVFSSDDFRPVQHQPWWKKRRPLVVSEMINFDSHILQWMQSQLGGRFRYISALPPFLETETDGTPIFTDEQILQSVQDLPVANTKAGLYIWLNACICARPFTDDMTMLSYLQNRYPGNNQALVVDLLVESFDVLTESLLQKEPEHILKIVCSFICNKIPLLLAVLSAFMAPPMTIDTCIQMAFISITMDAVPPISAGSTDVRGKLKTTRLEFLRSCALQGLISDNSITAILQDAVASPPRAIKQTKESLVAKHGNNIGSLEQLMAELESMSGNAGAIAGYIGELINNLCATKDTMSVKNLCNVLLKRVSVMDIILQHVQPVSLLYPLSTLLNDWTHDQDQMEFTPAYEEFACVLLFIFAVAHRYDLESADIGLQNNDTFVAKMLQQASVSKQRSTMTEEQRGHLGKWIEGLYATDEQGESSGIDDEVMRPCPPHAFYELVPTLFEQSVLACKSGKLSMKTFKGGLELLVEPFLQPSLIFGLSWLVKHSWEDHGDADTLLQILEKLLKPSSSSQESRVMHQAVLAIIAKPLSESLQTLKSKRAEKTKEVDGFVGLLRPYLSWTRNMAGSKAEVDEWTSPTVGGVTGSLRNAIQEQVAWVSAVGHTPPPRYTHKLFAVCCETVGAYSTLDVIVSEIAKQTVMGNGSSIIDICTAMMSSPMSTKSTSALAAPQQAAAGCITVRDALRLRLANIRNLLKLPSSEAEALARLGRRVDVQLAVTQMPQIALPMPIPEQAADQMMVDLGLTSGDLTAPTAADLSIDQVGGLDSTTNDDFNNADLTAAMDQSMDLTDPTGQDLSALQPSMSGMSESQSQDLLGQLGLDMSGQLPNVDTANISQQQNSEDDIFADIDLGADFDFLEQT